MAVFELVLALLLGGVGLTLLAPRLGVPWPALLALAGAALAFVPGIPDIKLDPDLALALFVAPVLLDSAYDASPRDLRRSWLPVASLVLGAVALTVVAVAVTAHWMQPALPWAAAFALGAIVAPPDAAAATSILRQVRLPHRIAVILEGESLLNDASALMIYRLAVGAAFGAVTAWTVGLSMLSAAASVILGIALAKAYLALLARIEDDVAGTVLGFLSTFGVWILADALELSAVLTTVFYALTLARPTSERMGARRRRTSFAVWEVAVFVLNVLAFVVVGLQLRGILQRLHGHGWQYASVALAVLATAILVRLVWVTGFYMALLRVTPRSSIGGAVAISWCGMRGIITLAAALALPERFPYRDLIVFTAFCVVLGTLVLQGMTLRPLLSLLTIPRDDSVDAEVALGRVETARAALKALEAAETAGAHGDARRLLEQDYRARITAGAEPGAAAPDATGLPILRRQALAAERECLASLRREERIGDAAFQRLEEELDWAEAEA